MKIELRNVFALAKLGSLLWVFLCLVGIKNSHAQVNAQFSLSATSGCNPLSITGTDLSTGTVNSWLWAFGNGNTSRVNSGVITTYTTPGTYTISLTVRDTLTGQTDTEFATVTVFADPSAGFNADITSGCAPLDVNFTDTSTPGDGTINNWTWDFGDGTLGFTQNPTHTYASTGTYTVTMIVRDDNGCQDSLVRNDYIAVAELAAVDFSAPVRTGCAPPLSVDFTASITPANPTYTYLWDFGDGTSSTQMNPSHFYSNNGSYNVSLTVTDPTGCQEFVNKPNYIIIDQPVSSFTVLNNTVCAGSQVSFINNSTGADSYTWNFGDGNTSNSVSPNHSYAIPGTYSVSLQANNSAGCNDIEIQNNVITVNTSPAAGFSANNNVGCSVPLTVNFTDNSSGSIIAWLWDFGNGVTSPSQNPITTYSNPGFYDVSLTVTNSNGCQSTALIPNYIQLGVPDADFIVGPTEGCAPLSVNFINTSTSPSDPIVSYAWNFGDGNISSLESPSHVYTVVGLYTVSLTITTASGCQDQEFFAPIEVGQRPIADFSANPLTACVQEDINFFDLTSGSVSDWQWDFGDGDGANIENPVHQYQDTGLFDVRLIVEFNGCRDTLERLDYIHIQGPVADFLMSPTAACNPPTTVTFFDNSINASTYLWDFGDGNTSTSANPSHSYAATGNYTVTLTIVDNVSGCTDQTQQVLPITEPRAAFTGDLTTGCVDMTVNFNNGSVDASSYVWDFGDGNTSTSANPSHTYTSSGEYTVRLIATEGACSDTLTRSNYIEAISTNIDFSLDVSSGCSPLAVEFTDLSTPYPGATINNVTWLFGDGGTATGSPVTYVYNTGGSFDVTLRVEDSEGCLTELTRSGAVSPTLPEAIFSTTDTIACPGSRIDFVNQSIGSIVSYQWDFGDGSPLASSPNPSHLYSANGIYTVTLTITDVNGCTDSEVKTSFLNIGRPTASFVADNTVATCPPMTVNFTDQSSPDVISWFWDFGDGSTSVLANPSKIYTIPGDYDVSLLVTNNQGCTDTLLMDDLIDLNGPTGAFTFTPDEGCRPLTTTFSATSPTPGWTYTWDFGDGTGGSGTSISHEYQTDTTINPLMFVEDDQGCSILVNSPNSVVIRPLPEPSFISNITEVCLGETVIFTNTSTSKRSIIDFLWDFGDGNTSSSINPTHTYADTGSYLVYLRLTTVDGCIDTSSTPLSIRVTGPPTAVFTATPGVGCEPYFVTFNESSTGNFPLVDWAWSFGDGDLGNGQIITPHQYTSAGNYTATLRVTDTRGCSNTTTQPVTVNALPPVEFSAFRYGCAPVTIAFTDETIHPAALVDWVWDFGDGTTSTVQNPNHMYATDGTYTVSLTATDVNGCTFTTVKTDYIKLEHPQANFTSNAAITCPPQQVRFRDASVPDTTISWRWDFGDGSPVSTSQNPRHTYYSSPDTFDVSLIVTNIFGCADTVVKPQHVINYEPPNASFTISDSSACVPENIVVASTSTANTNGAAISGYFWDFGTGSGPNSPTASFNYTTAGTYTLSLEVTDANGCKDTASKIVFIHPNPEIDFIAGDTIGCAVTGIGFTGVSTGVNTPVLWEWTFGDGKTGTGQNPVNTYFADGTYSVGLTATDANGCRDSVTKINYIELDHPTADFSVSQVQTCPGTTVNFSDISTGRFAMTQWIWDFGDGSPVSFQQNPSHSYTAGGNYTISLIVSDGISCRDTLTRTTFIEVYDPPVAAFTTVPPQGCAPLLVNFNDISTNGSASIVSWNWDFGDGGNAVIPNPTYSYSTAGSYTTTLTVTDANGCVSTTSTTVDALEIPVVDFIADQPIGCSPQGINFSDLTTSPYVKTSYLWDFGDGTTSTSPGPFHQYTSDGDYTVKLIVEDQNGCRDSLVKTNYIRLSHPVARFTWDDEEVCPNEPIGVRFSDTSIPDTTIVGWNWDFGDGVTSTLSTPSHSYSTPGTYTVTLTVTNILGCDNTISQNNLVNVLAPPATDFSMTDSANCTPLTINFSDLTLAGDTTVSTWIWDFGNGDASFSQNPSYTWNVPGVYTVSLTAIDLNGCETVDSVQVEAFEIPVAGFTASSEVGCAPQSVTFTNTSTSAYPLTYYKWFFGDGDSVINIANPLHVYRGDGDYTVTLIVGDANGCRDTLVQNNFIQLSHPTAGFTFDQSLVCPGIPVGVSFTDASIPDTTLSIWRWDFGDGTTSNLQNPSHSYSSGGSFTVSLIVENVLGCRDTLIQSSAIDVHDPPQTAFTLSDSTGCEPLDVDFTNTSTFVVNPIVSWDWRFGDGDSSLLSAPSHEFVNPGVYSVSLTAVDNQGCIASYQKDVEVFENPVARFTASDSVNCSPIDITFISNSTGSSTLNSWTWDFGDGNTSSSPVPVNTYASDGSYDVGLIVTDINGCSDTLVKPQYIKLDHPVASFTADRLEVCPGEFIQFTDNSAADTTLATWTWDFGDGNTSSVQNPSYSFTTPGLYTINLTVENIFGCGNTESKTAYIRVLTPPTADFLVADTIGCTPFLVSFTDNSTGNPDAIVSWNWDLGDGTSSTSQNPFITYTTPGQYAVSLTVTDSKGCSASANQGMEAATLPVANFQASDSVGCAAFITFTDESLSDYGISTWLWDFGDGNTSGQQSPTHSYASTGVYSVSLLVTDVNGCTASFNKPNYINLTRPVALFGQSQETICPGAPVEFRDVSIPDFPLVAWSWDFGDGNTSTTRNSSHIYDNPGVYTVTLTVTNSKGCTDIETSTVTVLTPPFADFNVPILQGCMPVIANFSDNSVSNSGPIFTWDWDFGDGFTGNTQNVAHTYTNPGTYTVRLTVSDGNGCTNDTTRDIIVDPLPNVAFIADKTTGCAPETINFTNQSTGTNALVGYAWDFGDGTTSTDISPSHAYASDGLYTVKLTVTDVNGCVDSLVKVEYIRLRHPQADFVYTPARGCPGTEVLFTDSSIPDTTLNSWSWDFGDGTSSTAQNPSHVYANTGFYTVSLTVTNILGCGDTETKTNVIEILEQPTVAFAPTDTTSCTPFSVLFLNNSIPATAPIVGYQWDFGDGNSSTLPNPPHTFTVAGDYQVQLIAVDANGCLDSVSNRVNSRPSPAPQITASDSLGCSPVQITFSDQTVHSANITSWLWDFGDGNTSAIPFPSHTYSADGLYDVSLTLTDEFGCVGTRTKTEWIDLSHPVADFSSNSVMVCPGTIVDFSDLSNPDTTLTDWLWDFGDGNTSDLQFPTHVYTVAGTYTISLTITNIFGCAHTETKVQYIEVLDAPTVGYSVNLPAACTPFEVVFTNQSTANSRPIVSWQWNFGDGGVDNIQDPTHEYKTAGIYNPILIATDDNGCSSSYSRSVEAWELPVVDFYSPDTLGCSPLDVSFFDQTTGASLLTTWEWDFGDGGRSSSTNPVHRYTSDGVYNVSLIVQDFNGCIDTLVEERYIRLTNPVTAFSYSPGIGCPGLEVQFTDESIPDTTIVQWQWSFGDGKTSLQRNPLHVYENPGVYSVSLTITNAIGCQGVEQKDNIIVVVVPPAANFQTLSTLSCTPFVTEITDLSRAFSAPIVDWHWDFGNGDNSNIQEPNYSYLVPGDYSITLRVIDANGCRDSITRDIVAAEAPVADFGSPDTVGCAPQSVRFEDYSTGRTQLISWIWDFGDGSTSSTRNPIHTYTQDGVYTVQLIVSDLNGCSDTLVRQNYIRLSHPQAEFIADQLGGCENTLVNFTDQSIGDTTLVGWRWDFGNGQQSIVQNPSTIYTGFGQFDVKLVVTNTLGCSDSITHIREIDIFEPPVAAFTSSDTVGCVPVQIDFSDLSTSRFGIASWEWFLDTVSIGQTQQISQYFATVGDYEIKLKVVDANGCVDSVMQLIQVKPYPVANFIASDTLGCAEETISFTDLSDHRPAKWLWDFGDGNTSIEQNPVHTYLVDGVYTVRLEIEDQFGCGAEHEKNRYIELAHPTADFFATYDPGCPPLPVRFNAEGDGLMGISTWRWEFGDGNVASTTEDTLIYVYPTSGLFSVNLTATDSLGCSVTVTKADMVNVIGDVIPDPISIHNVSTLENNQIQISWGPHTVEDFLSYTVYRRDGGTVFNPIHTSYSLNDTTFIDNVVKANARSYCYKIAVTNYCNSESSLDLTQAHCNVELLATPTPSQIVLTWNAYEGWPVAQYEIYKVDSYNTNDMTFLGVVPGIVNQFSEILDDCFSDFSYRVKAIGTLDQQISYSDTSQAVNFLGIVGRANQVVSASVIDDEKVEVSWNPYNVDEIALVYIEKEDQTGVSTITATLDPSNTSYIDQDVYVDEQSYTYRIYAQDSCGNSTPISNIGKTIVLSAEREFTGISLTWSEYEDWTFGPNRYEIEIKNDTTGAWQLVDAVLGTTTSYLDTKTQLDQPEYCYRIRAVERGGNHATSVSNEDCISLGDDVYIGNAFTPNGDGVNDEFKILGIQVQSFNLKIFSRWGTLLFETNSIDDAWDGTYKGQQVDEGAYTYIASGISYDGKKFQYIGSVTVLR